jgi:hypothetical protein
LDEPKTSETKTACMDEKTCEVEGVFDEETKRGVFEVPSAR